MLRLYLDRLSPMPLYHQIVQAIRWRIGTGALRAGDPLPPIRDAAEEWDVNYHTVRRAYYELAVEGWVEILQGTGTRVGSALTSRAGSKRGVQRWIDDVLHIGSDRFGLSATEVARLIQARQGVSRVVVVECNMHQAAALARQLEEAWLVEAIPWGLEQGEPPQLPIIGTYFHHAEMKRKWPARVSEMHFVAVRTDPALLDRIRAFAGRRRPVLRLVEQDIATAREMAAHVATVLDGGFVVEPVVGDPVALLDSLPAKGVLLVAPRLWDHIPDDVRQDPRVFDVQPTIVPEDLRRVWRLLNPVQPASRKRQRR